jgi:hypothetical protein
MAPHGLSDRAGRTARGFSSDVYGQTGPRRRALSRRDHDFVGAATSSSSLRKRRSLRQRVAASVAISHPPPASKRRRESSATPRGCSPHERSDMREFSDRRPPTSAVPGCRCAYPGYGLRYGCAALFQREDIDRAALRHRQIFAGEEQVEAILHALRVDAPAGLHGDVLLAVDREGDWHAVHA